MSVFFTSDLHFGHTNIIKYCDRPFADVHEMNKAMTERWNEVVRPQDTIYVLGDFAMKNDSEKYFNKLNGDKILIRGNHDGKKTLSLKWSSIHDLLDIKIENQHIVLCHYAMRVWNKSHNGSWMLYGHSHNKLPGIENSMDVGVDGNYFYPWRFEEIKKRLTPKT